MLKDRLFQLGIPAAITALATVTAVSAGTSTVENTATDVITLCQDAQNGVLSTPDTRWAKSCVNVFSEGKKRRPSPTPSTMPTSPLPSISPTPSTWPNKSNTGVPPGTTLTNCTFTQSQLVYDSCRFNDGVYINNGQNNVKITKSLIIGRVAARYGEQTGLLIEDSEIDASSYSSSGGGQSAVGDYNYTLRRVYTHGGASGPRVGMNVTIEDSLIIDVCCGDLFHKSGIGSNGGGNARIVHNTIECGVDGCSGAMALWGDFSQIANWTIDNNLLAGGAVCFAGGSEPSKTFPTAKNMVVTNNHFSRKFFPQCGVYRPAGFWTSGNGNIWTGNVWDDTGVAIPEPTN